MFCFSPRLQLLLFLKGFTESERNKLAMLTGILLANGNISASILNSLFNENLVKEGEEETSMNVVVVFYSSLIFNLKLLKRTFLIVLL